LRLHHLLEQPQEHLPLGCRQHLHRSVPLPHELLPLPY
jgi:hypothetical protein